MNLPNASDDFKTANPHIFGLPDDENSTTGILERTQPYSAKMFKSKTESEYAQILESMKSRGEILRWEYQGMTLRWFDMKYTPDFVVFDHPRAERTNAPNPWISNGIKMIEVKGPHIHYRQQAVARFKGARGFWPEFAFEMHQRTKDGWKRIY